MGLNKRFFSEKIINEYAKTHTYPEFKKMFFNSDIVVFLDDKSSNLYRDFTNTDSENQKILYETQKFK